jgi:integrase
MSTTRTYDIPRSLENLEQEVDQENARAVRDLINHFAAEGLSEGHQRRTIYCFKSILTNIAPPDFQLRGATKQELKHVVAEINRSDYAETTKHKYRSALKKFYKVENGGREHPEKVDFFTVSQGSKSTVGREDLFTDEELKKLFRSFQNVRDRAFTMVLYESAARPGELISRNIADFTTNGKGDFIYLEGLKGTPDRTNQLVRSGRTLREWIAGHPLGGEPGDIEDPSAALWVKTEQQACKNCGEIPHHHDDQSCDYVPDLSDRINYDTYRRRFKEACEKADIPENKRRPYNLRHTRLTEVATFMGYEQLNKFAGWVPGSSRAKIYVHLNNDDVNSAIREKYGMETQEEEEENKTCSFCGAENKDIHSECRNCGRPVSLEQKTQKEDKQQILERLAELEEEGVLEKLKKLDQV